MPPKQSCKLQVEFEAFRRFCCADMFNHFRNWNHNNNNNNNHNNHNNDDEKDDENQRYFTSTPLIAAKGTAMAGDKSPCAPELSST